MAKVTMTVEDVKTEDGLSTVRISKTIEGDTGEESIADEMVDSLLKLIMANAQEVHVVNDPDGESDENTTLN